jgi:septum formation protein
MDLVLASASPRRAELLRSAGLEFRSLPVEIDEGIRPSESPASYVRRLAAEKSAAALAIIAREGRAVSRAPGSQRDVVVIGADTAVVIDGEILGKPRDESDARAMLGRLSGRRHEVLTAVSLRTAERELDHVETTAVYFSPLSADDLAWYLASGEWRDKAGGYAIQGLASRFVVRLEGSYSNVVGLPVECVVEFLREFRRK